MPSTVALIMPPSTPKPMARCEPEPAPLAMLAAGGLDVVSVCTPNKFHKALTLAAFAAGAHVLKGAPLVRLEAMKMENPVNAHKSGVVTGLAVEAGAAITQGTVLAEIK